MAYVASALHKKLADAPGRLGYTCDLPVSGYARENVEVVGQRVDLNVREVTERGHLLAPVL